MYTPHDLRVPLLYMLICSDAVVLTYKDDDIATCTFIKYQGGEFVYVSIHVHVNDLVFVLIPKMYCKIVTFVLYRNVL